MTTDDVVQFPNLSHQEQTLLDEIRRLLPLLADLSRGDALLCLPEGEYMRVASHARPHSIAPVHREPLTGQIISRLRDSMLYEAVEQNRFLRRLREEPREGAPVQREALPICAPGRGCFAVLVVDTNLLESERMRRRSRVFQRVVWDLKRMAVRGRPDGAENLTPFGEHDGLLFADYTGVIRYMSGIATNLYRNIGYVDSLIGRPLNFLQTVDADLARQALAANACVECELEERGRTWVKKAIPIEESDSWFGFVPERVNKDLLKRLGVNPQRVAGTLIAIHDDTEARERERELKIKTTMIKEVHHRVKNDLQTVAALLRMQGRRMQTDEARLALAEAVNRILSIAVIHEFLSDQDSRIINIREIAQRILQQMQSGVLDPGQHIRLRLKGPNIYLTARQATSCALVINELLQNALEHGYDTRTSGGTISLTFEDRGDRIKLEVHDDGRGLPDDFDINRVDSLGLRIVRMLVTEDLHGTIELQSDHGVAASVVFPKIPLGGDEAWSEHE